MTAYIACVYKDPDSSFGVAFPDLPGCYGAGDSYDEALANARISLREYAAAIAEDGRDMPIPRTFDQLQGAAASESIELDKAAFVAEVPLITVGSRRRVNISMDNTILAALDQAAAVAGVNRSALLAEAAKEWMQAHANAVVARVGKRATRKPAGRRARKAQPVPA